MTGPDNELSRLQAWCGNVDHDDPCPECDALLAVPCGLLLTDGPTCVHPWGHKGKCGPLPDCGGCEGLGSHKRWCPRAVGQKASAAGVCAEMVDSLGDRIGSNDPVTTNELYVIAEKLRGIAERLREEPS